MSLLGALYFGVPRMHKNWGQLFIFDFTFSLFQEETHRTSDPTGYVKNKDLTPCVPSRMT